MATYDRGTSPRFERDGALSRNFSTRVGRSNRRMSRPYRRPITPLYSRFEPGDIVENAQADTITAAMWTNNDGEPITNELGFVSVISTTGPPSTVVVTGILKSEPTSLQPANSSLLYASVL